ncbi:MAG: DUF459 domain-containing protein [Treponema sp.]|jgi:hypothetical protein|nr:DUF459 domain-containing protein [Treponema sp.]
MRLIERPFHALTVFLAFVIAFVFAALQETNRLDSFIRSLPFENTATAAELFAGLSRVSGMAGLASLETRFVRSVETLASRTPRTQTPPETAAAAEQTGGAAPEAWFNKTREITVLIAGDSMIADYLGAELQRKLSRRGEFARVIRDGRYSTGLSRDDYFDWPSQMTLLVNEHKPDLVIICLGGNDVQDIIENGKRYHPGSGEWNISYRKRAEKLIQAAATNGARLVWLGLPIVGNEKFAADYKTVVYLQELACNFLNSRTDNPLKAEFIDNWTVLADPDGSYNSYRATPKGLVRVRNTDRIHVNQAGAEILAEYDLARIYGLIGLPLTAKQD